MQILSSIRFCKSSDDFKTLLNNIAQYQKQMDPSILEYQKE